MEWFEYLIILLALFLVILPIILKIRDKKKGKMNCGCGMSCKGDCNNCPLCHRK